MDRHISIESMEASERAKAKATAKEIMLQCKVDGDSAMSMQKLGKALQHLN